MWKDLLVRLGGRMWWCAGACCTVSNPPKFNLEDKAEAEDCGNDRAQNNLEIQREVLDIHDSHVKWAKRLGRSQSSSGFPPQPFLLCSWEPFSAVLINSRS